MIYRRLKKYAAEKIIFAYIGILLSFIAALLSVFSYGKLYSFLQMLIQERNTEAAIPLAWQVVCLLLISTAVYFTAVIATHVLAFRLETNLKKEGVRRLSRASFSFFDRNESGRVRKVIDDNTVMTHTSVAHLIPDLTTALFVPLLGLILVLRIDLRMGVFFFFTLIVGVIIMMKMMGERSFMAQYMRAAEKMNAGAVEYVRGIHVLKIFKARMESLKDFYRSVTDYSDLALKYSMSCRGWFVRFQLFFNAIFLAVMLLFYQPGTDRKEALVKFMFYALFNGVIYIAFMKVMYVGMYVFQANSCIQKIEDVFEEMDQDKLEHGFLDSMSGTDIEFRDVSFGYNDSLLMEHLSFKLEAGKTYALVGASGSGKSTLAKLISGFYRLKGGEIRIGGHALTEYTEQTLAKHIANVFQDVKLFKRTLYENVAAANPRASREQVMEALHLAQCDEILNHWTSREQTMVGAKGVHLSGGEVQRIAIARAILKDADIVILDEASAAADPENEYELQQALSNLMKNKTVIMIAHRLTSIQGVDEILVIEDGKVLERGSHQQLMRAGGRYCQLHDAFMKANEWRVEA